MPRLLFVCQANVARSPSAEIIARRRIGRSSDWRVASVGTHALEGYGIAPELGAALERRGLEVTGHRARQVTRAMIDRADLVLTFQVDHRKWCLREAPGSSGKVLTIRRAAALLEDIPSRAEPLSYLSHDGERYTSEADDFDDPFGHGPEAAELAVTDIDRLLLGILPALGAAPRD